GAARYPRRCLRRATRRRGHAAGDHARLEPAGAADLPLQANHRAWAWVARGPARAAAPYGRAGFRPGVDCLRADAPGGGGSPRALLRGRVRAAGRAAGAREGQDNQRRPARPIASVTRDRVRTWGGARRWEPGAPPSGPAAPPSARRPARRGSAPARPSAEGPA